MQHQVCCNLDRRQEQAGLILASGPLLDTLGTTLLPLLDRLPNSTSKDVEQAIASLLRTTAGSPANTWAAVVMIHEGEAHAGEVGAGHVYHIHAGRLVPAASRFKLAAGDWLLLAEGELTQAALPRDMAARSADPLAQQLVGGSTVGTVLAVRCY
jgi:hypothetical protein